MQHLQWHWIQKRGRAISRTRKTGSDFVAEGGLSIWSSSLLFLLRLQGFEFEVFFFLGTTKLSKKFPSLFWSEKESVVSRRRVRIIFTRRIKSFKGGRLRKSAQRWCFFSTSEIGCVSVADHVGKKARDDDLEMEIRAACREVWCDCMMTRVAMQPCLFSKPYFSLRNCHEDGLIFGACKRSAIDEPTHMYAAER